MAISGILIILLFHFRLAHGSRISCVLVSLMVLIFLGSWRNTLVVAASVPLSIFAGVAGWYFTAQTNNLMTSGGMALAIGMLVDNVTVMKENIHRN